MSFEEEEVLLNCSYYRIPVTATAQKVFLNGKLHFLCSVPYCLAFLNFKILKKLDDTNQVKLNRGKPSKKPLEIFKTLNNLTPEYMIEAFYKLTNLTHGPLDIKVNQNNTNRYGS